MNKAMKSDLSFVRVEATDMEKLADWISGEHWPWHGCEHPSKEKVNQWIASGKYSGEANRPFWVFHRDHGEPVGLVCLEDLTDYTPIFDLRLKSTFRGKGFGKEVLRWLTEYVFTQTEKHRIEGHTRVDNLAMQRVFTECGWVKEAHYRQSWPDGHGKFYDALTFAVLKSDWVSGTVTPVNW